MCLRPEPPAASPNFTPQQVVWHVLSRLDDNHNPTANAGLTTLWNFFHRSQGDRIDRPDSLNAYVRDPGRDAELTQFGYFVLHAPIPTLNPLKDAAQPATIIHHDGKSSTVLFRLTLATDPQDKFRKEWRISDIEFDFEPPDPGKSGQEIAHGKNPYRSPANPPRILPNTRSNPSADSS